MNCSTLVPEEHYIEKENSRRTSRGLASCLRGESDEYYEAEGKYIVYYVNFIVCVDWSWTLFFQVNHLI